MPQNVDAEAGVIYEEVIEEISEIVVITDPGGIISYANSSFYNITGFDPASVIGVNVFRFFELPFDSKPGRSILQKIARGEQWIGYLLVCQREGDFLEMHTTIKPSERLPNGENQLILVGDDVTREKRLQKQLNEIQRLESLGTLADGIAHHFNNILASMMGQTELVIALLEERKDLKGRLRKILAAGERGKKFVSQLSTFCQTGGRDRYTPVRINLILEEALGFIQKVGLKEVTIKKSISDEEITVLANPVELNQVFLNLLTNSLQAMKRQSGNLDIVLRERKAPFAATGVGRGHCELSLRRSANQRRRQRHTRFDQASRLRTLFHYSEPCRIQRDGAGGCPRHRQSARRNDRFRKLRWQRNHFSNPTPSSRFDHTRVNGIEPRGIPGEARAYPLR